MPAGISGPLLSAEYLRGLSTGQTAGARHQTGGASLARARLVVAHTLGPAIHPWQTLTLAVQPLAHWLGWPQMALPSAKSSQFLLGSLIAAGADEVALLVVSSGQVPAMSRKARTSALGRGTRWAMVCDGHVVRLVDALRAESRSYLDFDLDACIGDPLSLSWLAELLAPAAFDTRHPNGLAGRIETSDALGRLVCRLLRAGVSDAFETLAEALAVAPGRRRDPRQCHDEALTAVYRILFLLFAEARQLVPLWHPLYLRAYSLDALRARLAARRSPRGTWAALQAIARLAHAGAEAGDLRVTAFNGRLFAPARAPMLDHLALDDRRVASALESLCFATLPGRQGRHRIAYAELGVEELGSVYESLLDAPSAAVAATRPEQRSASSGTARKTTGTFYTPSTIADTLVAETLGPLIQNLDAGSILQLRVVDPAMGSGAFLVSAGRFLLASWERALVERGDIREADLTAGDRIETSRYIASRCLFGVDRNPMAVQLAQLSVWLATLSSDRPLSFLDHHLVAGNSLVGASPIDVASGPPDRGRRARLPLEALFDWSDSLIPVWRARRQLEAPPDDDVSVVRRKESTLAALTRDAGLSRWKAACDVWCVAAMPQPPSRNLYHAMLDRCLSRDHAPAAPAVAAALEAVRRRARAAACFHWPLEFPEVFLDPDGRPRADAGFDAVIGNPPWEMLRADRRRDATAHAEGSELVWFTHRSGLYAARGHGHANQYQLFVERALQLVRPGGRIGLVVPSGLLADEGGEPLRRCLIRAHRLEAVTVFDNRRRLFPIHRGVRFATITAARGEATTTIRCRFGVLDPARAAEVPTVMLTPTLLERVSGPGLGIPDLPSAEDVSLVEKLAAHHPALSDPAGWHATFGRELNATDDRDCLCDDERGLPVLEGRHLSPFRVEVNAATRRADRSAVLRRLGSRAAIDRPRLAYRDVAAATNRTTMIAAILPAGTVTVHTVFCLRTRLGFDEQLVLCALLNSYVANYLVRRWVTTHVTTRILSRLPVPYLHRQGRLFDALAAAAATLVSGQDADASLAAQVGAAQAYGVTPRELRHILDTFPLVPAVERDAVIERAISETPSRSHR